MASEINLDDPRTFLYLKDGLKRTIAENAKNDPRFKDMSDYGRHIIKLGIEADKENRAKAIANIV
ncbi:MAG: hypothetical protein ACUZ8H_15500 [Candidatus Anammoxibacter sp.]